MKQSQVSGLDSLVECFFHIFIPHLPLFLSIITFPPLSPPFSHIPSHSFYVLSLSVMFKQLVNVIQISPPCYVALLHSFSVKTHMACEHNNYRVESHVDMAFTYNT